MTLQNGNARGGNGGNGNYGGGGGAGLGGAVFVNAGNVNLQNITCPALNIMAGQDDLVPCSQGTPFNDLIGSKDRRSILLKGSGVDVLYPELLALAVIALVMVSVSAWHFRKQLG